jgi:tetratricopeptide (TPR) repeat protein
MGKFSLKSFHGFNILSLGQRGVGKTVFLAGCYAELKTPSQPISDKQFWLDCQNAQDRKNLENILDYVARNGDYPPPTLKITDFALNLNQTLRGTVRPLCRIRWWDIPGETCDFSNPDFQQIVLESTSCCVFINAEKLVCDPNYPSSLEKLVNQVIAIANLLHTMEATKEYRFALVFTQCDRIAPGAMGKLQIEAHLTFLISALETARAKYQRFYSSIPIVTEQGVSRLEPEGTAEALLWLSADRISRTSPHSLALSLGRDKPLKHTAFRSLFSLPLAKLLGVTLGILGIAGAGLWLLSDRSLPFLPSSPTQAAIQRYQHVLKKNPQDIATLIALAKLYLEQQKFEEAIPVLEKIAALQPQELDWQLNLAKLYELTEKFDEAEITYDRIISRDPKQFKAFLGKAQILERKGDRAASTALLKQAEKLAPSPALKEQIRQMLGTRG